MATVYFVKVKEHPEIKDLLTASESLDSVARMYINMRDMPLILVPQLYIFDCTNGIEYDVTVK